MLSVKLVTVMADSIPVVTMTEKICPRSYRFDARSPKRLPMLGLDLNLIEPSAPYTTTLILEKAKAD